MEKVRLEPRRKIRIRRINGLLLVRCGLVFIGIQILVSFLFFTTPTISSIV